AGATAYDRLQLLPFMRQAHGRLNAFHASKETHMAGQFQWDDPFQLDQQLSEDERMVRDAARDYCQGQLAPRVLEMFRHEKSDTTIFREMGELGLLGPTIPTAYGGAGLNYVSYGLVAREIERVD